MRLSDLSNIFSNLTLNSPVILGIVYSTLCKSLLDDRSVWDKFRISSRRSILSCTNPSIFLFCSAIVVVRVSILEVAWTSEPSKEAID